MRSGIFRSLAFNLQSKIMTPLPADNGTCPCSINYPWAALALLLTFFTFFRPSMLIFIILA